MRALIAILLLLLLGLQYRLWFAEGGLRDVWHLQAAVETQRQEIERLQERNAVLEAEVLDLKQGMAAIEERARNELGMIKDGESFYRIVKPQANPPKE